MYTCCWPSKSNFAHKFNLNIYNFVNPLSANPEKWSNTLKQFVGNLPTNCLSVFDHFMNLALKRLKEILEIPTICVGFKKLSISFLLIRSLYQ